jgi:aquaporin TIP
MKAKALWAEFFGTFTLIFVGMMAIATNAMARADAIAGAIHGKNAGIAQTTNLITALNQGDIGRLGIALAHGLAIAVMVSATMAISGGNLNPAVSFGLWVAKRITAKRMLGYWIVQCAGGIAAAFLADIVLPSQAMQSADMFNASYGVPSVAASLTAAQGGFEAMGIPMMALLIEAIITFFLVYVVLGTGVDRRAHKVGGLFIGLTITMGILAAGPLTGGSMNPARWLGPAFLYSGQPAGGSGGVIGTLAYANWPVYIIGPLLGAAIAAIAYRMSHYEGDELLG